MGRRCFLRIVIGVVAAVLGLGSPASAAVYCDSIPDRVPDAELDEMRIQLRHNFPARHADLLSRLRLVNGGGDPKMLGPTLADRNDRVRPTVHIPPGFRRLQCRMSLVHSYLMWGWRDPNLDPGRQGDSCPLGKRLMECLDRMWTGLGHRMLSGSRFDAESMKKVDELLAQLAKSAFLTALSHEVAHIVIDDSPLGRAVGSKLDDESAADVVALVTVIAEGNLPLATVSTPAMLAVIDHRFDWTDHPHPPNACRAKLSDEILRRLGPEIALVYTWLLKPESYAEQKAKIYQSLNIKLAILGDPSACPPADLDEIEAVRRDFVRLVATIEGLGGDNRSPEQRLERLLGVTMATREGERLRANFALLWYLHTVQHERRYESDARLRASAPLIARTLDRFRPDLMTSEAWGRALGHRALMNYSKAGPGASLTEMNDRLAADVAAAERFYSGIGIWHKYLGRAAIMEGRCREGLQLLNRVNETGPPDPGLKDQLASWGSLATTQDCSAAARDLRADRSSGFGWRQ